MYSQKNGQVLTLLERHTPGPGPSASSLFKAELHFKNSFIGLLCFCHHHIVMTAATINDRGKFASLRSDEASAR